jgi:DNA end-binding protein Ku
MVKLAVQLVDRQTATYDPADIEDRYETRLRAMLDAKLKGAGVDMEEEAAEPAVSNVVDLMAALKRSLGEPEAPAAKAKPAASAAKPKAPKPAAKPPVAKGPRKRAS